MAQIFLTRHFQRVDDSDSSLVMSRKWNETDRKIKEFEFNPYLSDVVKTNNITDTVLDKIDKDKIDIVISSPFLRCMQTAKLLMDKLNESPTRTNKITKIKIHFGLSEIIDTEFIFYAYKDQNALNISEIYDFSLSQFNDLERNLFEKVDTENNIINNEVDTLGNEDDYHNRIKTTLVDISVKYYNKNILVVTHADSYKKFNDAGKRFGYNDIFPITDKLKTDVLIRQRHLCTKYVTKYLIKLNLEKMADLLCNFTCFDNDKLNDIYVEYKQKYICGNTGA